jgi:indolepyruvate ferredoxin oxidoreductase
MIGHPYRLSDRYQLDRGQVFLTGVQALARIPIEQLRRDRANGRSTAALVSGYPGSPLGGFDLEMARALREVPDLPIVHQPAVNEELGATAVMGSQLVATRPDQRYDGVVGVWYGKAPGLDRATDALRHGVFAGSSAGGGAIALVGDDPAAKSSTMPSSSDAALVDLHMPILYPATVGECLELGLHGIAMSRATGLWSALKIVTPIADGTGTLDLPILEREPSIPTVEIGGGTWTPMPSAQFLGPRMVAAEQEFHEVRLDLARRYGIENGLNRVTTDPRDAWLGIIATGYTYAEVLEALRRLGLPTLDSIGDAGIRLLQLRLPVPFDAAQIVDVARDVDEIIVVEEKNPTLEHLVRDALYESTRRPLVVGKQTPDGTRLMPSHGLLDADSIAPALRSRLVDRLGDRLAPPPPKPRELIPLSERRAPFFCSGCPHNWGTKVPDDAVVGMGTGCHGMTLLMDDDRVGESIGITAMGNEGAHWIGMAPFVETPHVFQNLGDGTYFHSAQLAVQAAIGAGTNVTFKLLYNDTIAMTGGQETSFRVGVVELAQILLLQGVSEVVITTESLDRYRGRSLPLGVDVHDRTEIVAIQERLAAVPGVTMLIHDQECAAELRRARNRRKVAAPTTRVVINHRICEGCGDCGDVSNCLSVQPVETPLGRKTQIDQASCNVDLSCLGGDCPAFMTVEVDPELAFATAEPVGEAGLPFLADPPALDAESAVVRMAGIGGTGVVTAAQVLGTAAMLGGYHVDGLDQTGLSQKAGPVVSDLSLTRTDLPRRTNLIGAGQADLVIAFDLLVAASDQVVGAATAGHTVVVASTTVTPTGRQVSHPDLVAPSVDELVERFVVRAERVVAIDASAGATALAGTAAAANILLLGAAVQTGLIPVPLEAFHEAIRLNGVAVEQNLAAFRWGRRWVAHPDVVAAVVQRRGPQGPRVEAADPTPRIARRIDRLGFGARLNDVVRMLATDLIGYQNERYASRFLDLVERTVVVADTQFTETVARMFHKLLAYKDEYEVARLMRSPDGLAPAVELADGDRSKISWHLHPPTLRAMGVGRKLRFAWRTGAVFTALARGKRLRGSRLDPFGRGELRAVERALPDEYEAAIGQLLAALARGAVAVDRATEIAALPDAVRGFEDLKLRRAADYRAALAAALAALE